MAQISRRYLIVIWTEGSDKLKVFVDYLNNLHPTIKFTCSHSLTNIPFLDVMVSLKDGLIQTDLYTKPTDKHQYLLISSCHPTHTKRSIPYSLALRLRRICSDDDTYKQRCKELMDYLVNRGYEHPDTTCFRVTPLLNPNLNNRQILFLSSLPIIPLYLTYPV